MSVFVCDDDEDSEEVRSCDDPGVGIDSSLGVLLLELVQSLQPVQAGGVRLRIPIHRAHVVFERLDREIEALSFIRDFAQQWGLLSLGFIIGHESLATQWCLGDVFASDVQSDVLAILERVWVFVPVDALIDLSVLHVLVKD